MVVDRVRGKPVQHYGSWIHHFADHASWSNATLICKGMAPYGAVALGEIDRIGERMKGHEGDAEVWHREWTRMAAHVERLGDEASAKGHTLTAAHYYLRAGNYYYTGERMIAPGPQKTATYKKALACYHRGLTGRYPTIERLDVPCEGGDLPAYFLPAERSSGPAPTVVVFDGLDNCKEMSIVFAGLEFAARGYNTLSVDGPGQGEALRLRNIPYRHDYEVAGAAAYDWLLTRPEVDPSKVVVMGYSFGGYCAPRVASLDQRYAGCVAFGATYWDMTAWLKNKFRIADDPTVNTTNSFQVQWVLGTPTREASFEKIARFSLAGVVDKMACPFLVVHGEDDPLVPMDSVQRLHDESGSPDKAIKIFTADEGGAEHCQVDDRQAGIDYIADWIADHVVKQTGTGPARELAATEETR